MSSTTRIPSTPAAVQLAITGDDGTYERGYVITFGPLLTECVERALQIFVHEPLAWRNWHDSIEHWLLMEVVPEVVPADERGIKRILKDTPGLLGYPIDLWALNMKVVTPGWFIGEAAYQAVAKAAVKHYESVTGADAGSEG